MTKKIIIANWKMKFFTLKRPKVFLEMIEEVVHSGGLDKFFRFAILKMFNLAAFPPRFTGGDRSFLIYK